MSQLNLYRTETTTKSVKTEKLKKVKDGICSEVTVNSLGNPCCDPEEEKERLQQWEGFAEKECFKPEMKESVGDGIPITISMTVGR